MKFINCGPDNELIALEVAVQSTMNKAQEAFRNDTESKLINDWQDAYALNNNDYRKFIKTDFFARGYDPNYMLFQTRYKYFCKDYYRGEAIDWELSNVTVSFKHFKKKYCPSVL